MPIRGDNHYDEFVVVYPSPGQAERLVMERL